MADTGSRNFRCPDTTWDAAQLKAQQMRQEGYDIDVTKVLNAALGAFLAETSEHTAERLALPKGGTPAPVYRRPKPRMAAQ
jgi:hypothetical protein